VTGTDESLDPSETRALLAEGDLHLLGLMPGASNYTFLGEIRDGPRRLLAVYKPRDGEMRLWDFAEGTLCRREVAASLLAEDLGWPSVPITVFREGPHGPGAVQQFVQADPHQHFFTMRGRRLEEFRPAALFDAIINNGDRKSGHCLEGAQGTIWLVDHGVSFSVEPKLRTVIWDFAGDPIPPSLCADLGGVAARLDSGRLREALLELLTKSEVDAAARRARALVSSGRFPAPGSERPYPWPPV